MKKSAQIHGLWPDIYKKLKNPPPGLNLGNFPSKLPSMDKIIFDSSAPSGKGDAIGYVTTADADNNGKLDSLHIVIPNMQKHLQGVTSADLQGEDLNRLSEILKPFIEVIAHEVGHLQDYKKDSDNAFPGGESVAESAASQAKNQISVKASKPINNTNRNVSTGRNYMGNKILSSLVTLANRLDDTGKHKLADEVTSALEKFAVDIEVSGEEDVVENKQKVLADIKSQFMAYAKTPEQQMEVRRILAELASGRIPDPRSVSGYMVKMIDSITPAEIGKINDLATQYVAESQRLKQLDTELDEAMYGKKEAPQVSWEQANQMLPEGVRPTEPKAEPAKYDHKLAFKDVTGMDPGKEGYVISGIQSKLKDLGYDIGKVDGIWGPKSRGAWAKFFLDFQEAMTKSGLPGDKVALRLKMLNSGNVPRVLSMLTAMKTHPSFIALKQNKDQTIANNSGIMSGAPSTPAPEVASFADDEAVINSAEDCEVEPDAEKLVVDASFNAVFWDKNSKTPFGR